MPPDGKGDAFGVVNRGTGLTLPLVAQDFIDHATEEDYDNWYYGSTLEESLSSQLFNIRPGARCPKRSAWKRARTPPASRRTRGPRSSP